jgi:hypothetical protein
MRRTACLCLISPSLPSIPFPAFFDALTHLNTSYPLLGIRIVLVVFKLTAHRYGLGSMYMKRNKMRLAEYHYRKALDINGNNAVILGCMGIVSVTSFFCVIVLPCVLWQLVEHFSGPMVCDI